MELTKKRDLQKRKLMKKQILLSIGLSIVLTTGCSNHKPKPNVIQNQENNTLNGATIVKQEDNSSKKPYIIDLDQQVKDDGLKGGEFKTILGFIYKGNNDEVSFLGEKLFISTPIKLYINGKTNETTKFIKGILTIKTSELAAGDTVVIKNRFGTKLAEHEVKE